MLALALALPAGCAIDRVVRLAAPTGLIVAEGTTTVDAVWDAVVGADSYEYNVGAGWVTNGTSTSVADVAVAYGPGAFRVRAVDVAAIRGRSAVDTFAIPYPVPGAPTALSVEVDGLNFTATWGVPLSDAAYVVGYKVRLDADVFADVGNVLAFAGSGAAGEHTFEVVAYNADDVDSAAANSGPFELGAEPGADTFNLLTSGRLVDEDFANLYNWTGSGVFTVDTSNPEYTIAPFDRVLVPLTGSIAGTRREPTPIVDLEEGVNAIFHDSCPTSSDRWGVTLTKLTNNWMTITHDARVNPPLESYDQICSIQPFVDGSTKYFYGFTAFGAALPSFPYGNILYTLTDWEDGGTYTVVRDNNPPTGGTTQTTGQNSGYHLVYDPDAAVWVLYTATAPTAYTDNWSTGRATAATMTGVMTMEDDRIFPVATENSDSGYSENLRVWFAPWGKPVGIANLPGSYKGLGIWYASGTTLSSFSTCAFKTLPLVKTASEAPVAYSITPGSPLLGLDTNVVQDADGAIGLVYGGDPETSEAHFLNRLRAGQMEPWESALAYSSLTGSPQFISRPQPADDFVAIFTVERTNPGSGTIQFWFDGTSPSDSASFYAVRFSDTTGIWLYKNTGGTYATLVGPVAVPPTFQPDGTNFPHDRFRIERSGTTINVWVNESLVMTYGSATLIGGTKMGWRVDTTEGRILGFRMMTSDEVTVTGLTAGDVVSLHGAGKLPAVEGTAVSGTLVLSHRFYPLKGIQIMRGGEVLIYHAATIWGGSEWHYGTATPDTTPPTVASAEILEIGNRLVVNLSEDCEGTAGFAISGFTATYLTGSGTNRHVYSLTPDATAGATLTLNYTAGTVEDLAGNALANFTGAAIDNNTVSGSLPYTTGILVDVDPTELVLNDGDAVAACGELSQATAGKRPKYRENIFGSRPAIEYDNIQNLQNAVAIPQPCTALIVVNTTAGNARILESNSTSGARAIVDTGTSAFMYAGSSLSTGASGAGLRIVIAVFNGASSKLWIDGALAASGDAGSAGFTDGVILGTDQTEGSYFLGTVGRLTIFDHAMADADVADLTDWADYIYVQGLG